MPQVCEISRCEYSALTNCRCCQKHFCREHFLQHDQTIQTKFNRLTSDIETMIQRLQEFDVNEIIDDVAQKLNQWRFQSYEIIEKFYRDKYQEIYRFIEENLQHHEKKCDDLQLKLVEMINAQRATTSDLQHLTTSIESLKREIDDLENLSIDLHADPLIIRDNQISMEVSVSTRPNLSAVPPILQRIDRLPLSSSVVSSNDRHILIHQNSNLILLNKSFDVVRCCRWPHDWIRDMSWSMITQSFILVTSNKIYSIREENLVIECLNQIEGRAWQSCTCSETSLFLSKDLWNSTIEEYSIYPTIQFVKLWKTNPILGYQQRIDSLNYADGTIILTLNDRMKNEISIELRSIETFECLWSCPLDLIYSERKVRCSSFDRRRWLITDWGTSALMLVNKNGRIIKKTRYDFEIHHVHRWKTTNTLIITTNSTFNIHQF